MTRLEEVIKEHFYESRREETEKKKPRVCKEGLEIECCRQCLFEALCKLNGGLDK